MTDVAAAQLIKTPKGGRLILWMAVLFVSAALVWANWAKLDEVTTGIGQVIPSSQIQVVQNLEGGIVGALLVSEGETVEKDQVLLQIDDTRFSASLRETRLQYLSLKAKAARLQAESELSEYIPPQEVLEERPNFIDLEKSLYQAKRSELDNNRKILEEQTAQRKQELQELNARQNQLRRSLSLVERELSMTQPLVKAGAISEVEVLRLEREVNELAGQLESTTLSIPRIQSTLDESLGKLEELDLRFKSKAREEWNAVNTELSGLVASSVALEDRVKRTAVRSPVKGTIKQLMVNTVGGVIQPGMELVKIVPLEDNLLVEAKIRPEDIGFLRPGQKTIVKFTAFDFAIFGGMEGKLEHISADTIKDDEGNSFYQVRVRTAKNQLGSETNPLKIIPGMQAEVDILTGKKTVLSYLLKPVLRANERAMRER
ncbi:MAG: HlyD family type I secretion periplasmic adaptor subunit [Sedimenticola selenatireducens]|uniref:Membrane fusion protein (MFP) family protein n=2 Tax=Sedimenticola selenatireducens TaxID=191960 RepID=A0A557RTX9_9GAMM|nr:HlyD family type I secretion periplasmic adaptor subunit [Sedimenticola selenatireducens]TVT66543.1 MAG: HlyD family type I secretion periplasmic adaptor subunit [Sedimenticola selenatireducens]